MSFFFRKFAGQICAKMKICRYIVRLAVFAALLLPVQTIRGQYVGSGTSTFAFLDLPVSSRQNALGGENISIRDGELSSAFANPALLGSMTHNILQLGYAYYGTNHFGSVMYGYNFGEHNYFAAGIHYLDYGKMAYAEDNGQRTGINFGDVGGHFQLKDSTLQIGLALKNIGWQLKGFYSDESGQRLEMLPINLELGINYRVKHAPLRFSLTIHNIQRWDLGYSLLNETELPVKPIGWFDMMMRHTIWAIDIVPKSEKFYLTLSYNHRRRQEFNLQDQRSLAEPDVQAELHLSGQPRDGRQLADEVRIDRCTDRRQTAALTEYKLQPMAAEKIYDHEKTTYTCLCIVHAVGMQS